MKLFWTWSHLVWSHKPNVFSGHIKRLFRIKVNQISMNQIYFSKIFSNNSSNSEHETKLTFFNAANLCTSEKKTVWNFFVSTFSDNSLHGVGGCFQELFRTNASRYIEVRDNNKILPSFLSLHPNTGSCFLSASELNNLSD